QSGAAAGAEADVFAQVFPQCLDGARQRGLLDVQSLGSTGEVESFGHSEKAAKVAKLHSPSILFARISCPRTIDCIAHHCYEFPRHSLNGRIGESHDGDIMHWVEEPTVAIDATPLNRSFPLGRAGEIGRAHV